MIKMGIYTRVKAITNKSLRILFGLVIFYSCNSTQHSDGVNNTSNEPKNVDSIKTFDLSDLTLNEKLTDITKPHGLTLDQESDQRQTLHHYKTFSNSALLLNFGGKSLEGKSFSGNNEVIFHYDAEDGKLGFYEVILYTKAASDSLLKAISSQLGQPVFEKSDVEKGSVEIDENGDLLPAGKGDNLVYKVWEDDKTHKTYYVMIVEGDRQHKLELTVLKKNTEAEKEWISFRALDHWKSE